MTYIYCAGFISGIVMWSGKVKLTYCFLCQQFFVKLVCFTNLGSEVSLKGLWDLETVIVIFKLPYYVQNIFTSKFYEM